MGKVLIVSDNHGQIDTLKKIIAMEKPVDLVIHCGDSEMTDINFFAVHQDKQVLKDNWKDICEYIEEAFNRNVCIKKEDLN